MSQYFMPIYTTIIGMIIGALTAWVKSLIKKKNDKEDLVGALTDGMAILLRKEIKEYYVEYEYKDGIPMEDWTDIQQTHDVYKQLHGNSSADRMYEELRKKHLESKS